ncbi:S1 domain-containing post-transcriptional regulator GSP13 [Oceanobacillus kimchii]|uniref:S1 domain-containing post-transcriptional regulator GSP13 n=1 Tax=Oceanobacillus kimchii TaxID=746691 RepID=UPI000347823B|nr:S1 domain-containing post-transcriptional regulator GSP13 [Oceanobacillus kimchii]MCT1579106.1 S1 domain-containing post-transcriptional regulator GSP13 [Oceanobacillus kimchii]MCT2137366.1 S1 domain-containing post-transcriptional regulator GSP13 [Oceanobacillus kimchii]
MTNKLEAGQIIEGKVTGIQPYGAFVSVDEETQGLVHISEITHGYVKDINEHLSVGDEVKVKVINVDDERNKVSLSIRATEEAPKANTEKPKKQAVSTQSNDSAGFNTLKDKLQEWINQSDNK